MLLGIHAGISSPFCSPPLSAVAPSLCIYTPSHARNLCAHANSSLYKNSIIVVLPLAFRGWPINLYCLIKQALHQDRLCTWLNMCLLQKQHYISCSVQLTFKNPFTLNYVLHMPTPILRPKDRRVCSDETGRRVGRDAKFLKQKF